MLLIVGTVRLPPENLERAREAMRVMIAASRAEDGCVDYGYAEDVLEPGLIHVKEFWRDRASLDRHFASPYRRMARDMARAWHQRPQSRHL